MKKVIMAVIEGQEYLDPAGIATMYAFKPCTARERLKDFYDEVERGTYPKTAVVRDGEKVKRAYLPAFVHYMSNRDRLTSGNKRAREMVPPYSARAVLEEIGAVKMVLTKEQKRTAELEERMKRLIATLTEPLEVTDEV